MIATVHAREKYTQTMVQNVGPLVVDIWEPLQASNVFPILLIHGWGGTGNYWEETALALSETARVIVPDLPGTGRSQPVRYAQNMFDQVQNLADLLDELALDRVQVVGHSMGSAMAVLLADKCPQRVERLVLTSLSFFIKEWQEHVYRAVMQAFRMTMGLRAEWMVNVPGLPQMMASRYFHRIPRDQDLLKQGLRDYLQLDAATAMACAYNAPDTAIPEAGARLQAPTLLVACRQDHVMPPENVDHTASVIPNCEVVWIEECGHLPMLEKPQDYLTVLRDFLQL